jgi:hypothetical protein
MDACIIYLKDGIKAGKVEVSVELIGDPVQSLLLADAIVGELAEQGEIDLTRESVFITPVSDTMQ